jgi:quinol monooxygenase YgiN
MSHGAARIVELRRYALKPGARDTLIELFDRELVETQEEVGMEILGQFRDLDDPDSFVWIRRFRDMRTRRRALDAFYGGPVWKQHGPTANVTMLDVSNVLLLRPLSDLELDAAGRPPPGSEPQPGLVVITIYPLTDAAADFDAFFRRELEPALATAGIRVHATYVTEHSENTFPSLPVREDANVFLWMTMCADEADHARRVATFEGSSGWRDHVSPALARLTTAAPEVLRLAPTARSLIHG